MASDARGDYAVVYDVSDDRERARVDRVLLGFGFRVQKSVFECRLTRGEGKALARKLAGLQLRTGAVKIYRLQAGAEHVVIGQSMPSPDSETAYVV